MLEQATRLLRVDTQGNGFYDITDGLRAWLAQMRPQQGLLTLHVKHTSCSLVVQENADPDVRRDLIDALDGLAPRDAGYRHSIEGPDDMPAHIRTMLTATSVSVPIFDGQLQLGTWQGVALVEHRDAPHRREIAAHLLYSS